jgi:general secretion pathway protein F
LESRSEQAALETLQAMGLSVVDIREGGGDPALPWYRREIRLSAPRMPLEEQAALAERLAVLFQVRLPVLEVLRLLGAGERRRPRRLAYDRVRRLVADGLTLPEAFARAGPPVSPLFLALLRMGQGANALPELLQDLAATLRAQERMRAQVLGAFIYPLILCAAALILFLLVALVLAPALAPSFAGQGRALPAALGFFLTTGELLERQGAQILGLVLAAALLISLTLRRQGARLLSRLPLVGRLMRGAALVRLAKARELMLRAGLPLPAALRAAADAAPAGDPYRPVLCQAAERLEAGGSAYEAFAGEARVLPLFAELFRIGEETNTLPLVLQGFGRSQAGQVERQAQRLMQALTPVLTLLIGGAVGLLVYHVMDAVLSVNELVL